jgi:hypothetical protein
MQVNDTWRHQVMLWCDARHDVYNRRVKVVFDPDNIVDDANVADLIDSLDRAGKAVALPRCGNTMTTSNAQAANNRVCEDAAGLRASRSAKVRLVQNDW